MRAATILLALCAAAGCGPSDPPAAEPRDAAGPGLEADVRGTWAGTVIEDDLRYDLVLTLDRLVPGADAGKSVYSGGLSCTGTLTFEARERRVHTFREDLHGSEVCANGRIDVYPRSDGRLGWLWFRDDGDAVPDARATLDRP